jgi:hypothetical protein
MIKNGEFQSPPPPFPCIRTDTCVHNLDLFIDMSADHGLGNVFAEKEWLEWCRGI